MLQKDFETIQGVKIKDEIAKHGNNSELGVGEVPDFFGLATTEPVLGFCIRVEDEHILPPKLPRYRCTQYLDTGNVQQEFTLQSHLQRWEGQGTTTFNWINQEKDQQITAVTRSCNSRAHLIESVSWTTIQDAVAKVKHDQEEEEQRLMGKGPSTDVEPATVQEAGLNEFTLKLPGMASAKLPESTKSAAVSKCRKMGSRRKAD